MWDLLSNNAFVGALVSGIAIVVIVAIFNLSINKYKSYKVFQALEKGLSDKKCTFLSSSYLAAQTNYTQAKVEHLCSSHPKIKRNEKALESWKIIK